MDIDQDHSDSEELRLHIHHLLHDYSRTHYTTNYIGFTENFVGEFVDELKPIPLTDPYSPVIPSDPYDVFSQMHGLPSLAPYNQTFKTTEATRLYLKNFMGSRLGFPKTERVMWDDDYGRDPPLHEPVFVSLSRKSRQSTPKLGSKKQTHSPNLYRQLLKSQNIEPIHVEEIEDPPLSIDRILQLKPQIGDEEIRAVRSLLQSTATMLRHQEGYKNKYLDPIFLRDDSSAYEYKHHEIFVPIFPRARMPKSGMASGAPFSAGFNGFVNLPSKIIPQVAVQNSDDDISTQNLVVIDGWETIRSSPPSTPSSGTADSDDEMDELLLHSTPNTEPAPIQELYMVQMEVPQFPRSRKIGGNDGIKPHILAGKTLTTFLQPLLVKTTMQTDQEPVVQQRSSPEPSSLFGQPPSALEFDKEKASSHEVNDELNVEIENLYQDQNLRDFIMEEVIDEKKNFLMQVPDLPQPNVYARKEIMFPTKLPGFLIPPDLNREKSLPYQFLKKMKGKQSLNLALSWVTFTVDKKLPTVAEAAGVTDLFHCPSDSLSEVDLAKVDMALCAVSFTDPPPNPARHCLSPGEESSSYRPSDLDGGFKMLLNRGERRRVAKLEGRTHDMKDYDFDFEGSVVHDDDAVHLLELSAEPEIALHSLGSRAFAQLRAKTISSSKETQLSVFAPNVFPADQDPKPRETPMDIYDSSTIRLPQSVSMPQSIHRYMASIDIIQKQALVRSLESQESLVDLVERHSLDGVDLIIDPHSAIIFLSLFSLPSQCDKYVERVAKQSWKFRRILVIFEAYPQSCARKGDKTLDSGLNAYTPPILRAIKKFRRDMNVVAACGTKCQETELYYAFANSVDEGALFARLYGNRAEEKDETGGAIWGDRGWLDGDFLEDEESNLASAGGMNRFSASIVLCQVSLQEFLTIDPEERIVRFGGYIGNDNVNKFNIDLEDRYRAMNMMCTSE